MVVFEWIEGWYNPRRRHSSIGRTSTSAVTPRGERAGALPPHPRDEREAWKKRALRRSPKALNGPRESGNSTPNALESTATT